MAGGAFGNLGYPKGAHYLPLPSMESTHLRDMLADLGVIEQNAFTGHPVFDERILMHAPDERLFLHDRWQDGLLPVDGVARTETEQYARFFACTDRLRTARGSDGKKLFCIPLEQSSTDAQWRALDTISFTRWLANQGYTAPTLLWYLNYCCRDDYGAGSGHVSAWAGLHYFCARNGHARNAGDGAVLTWPDGLHSMATKLGNSITSRLGHAQWALNGFATRIQTRGKFVEINCAQSDGMGSNADIHPINNANVKTYRLQARRVVCAMPLFVAAHVMPEMRDFGFDASRDLLPYAPWLVSNFLMDGMPRERAGVPLAWDNVVYRGPGMGYVVSTHQLIRMSPPQRSVFSAYQALDTMTPDDARLWLATSVAADLRAQTAIDLKTVYGRELWRHAAALDITVRAHAMATPAPGFLSQPGRVTLRHLDASILFAHSDLSGLSLFEEASYWGIQAARRML